MAKRSSPRTRSSDQKKSKNIEKRAPKRCNYCRNHMEEIVLERGHGTCEYNNHKHFKECIKCERNYNKTRIARKFRENKLSSKNIVASGRRRRSGTPEVSSNSDKIVIGLENQEDLDAVNTIMELNEDEILFNNIGPMLSAQGNIELFKGIFIDNNEVIDPSNNLDSDGTLMQALDFPMINYETLLPINNNQNNEKQPQSGFSMIVVPTTYPNDILYPDNEEQMKNFIEKASDELEKAQKEKYKIQYKTLEVGRWKVVCLDEYTRDLFLQEVSQWKLKRIDSEAYLKLRVVPEHELPRYIHVSCILKQLINDQEFLPSIIAGGQLNASRWSFDKIEPFGDKYKVYFGIDPRSYRYLYTDAYWITVKNEYVKVSIEYNPFTDKFAEYSQTCNET